MKKRPLSITIIGIMLIVVELIGLVHHALEFNLRSSEFLWSVVTQLLAIIGGTFLLLGCNWARWLVIVWMGFHVVLSIFHEPFELVVHCLFLAVLIFFLFRGPAAAYFRNGTSSDREPAD